MKKIISLCFTFVFIMLSIAIPSNAAVCVDKSPGEISTNSGQFTITLDDNATEEVLSEITFKKKIAEDEFVDIKGGAFVKADDTNPNEVIVKYGTLENETEYVLDVCGSSFNYYTTQNAIGYEEDFEEYEIGDQLPARPEVLTEPIIYYPSSDPDPKYHYICESEDGDKFVRLDLSKPTSTQGGTLVLEFPQPIENQDICVDMKLRVLGDSTGSRTRTFFGTYFDTSDKSRSIVAQWSSGNGIRYANDNLANGTYEDTDIHFAPIDGFYDLRLTIRRNDDGTFTQMLEDLNNPEDGKIVLTNKSTTYSKIYKIWLARFYGGNQADIGLDVSSVKYFPLYDFDVLNVDDLNYNDNEVAVTFSDDADENTLSNVTMTDSKGKIVELTYDRYDSEKRTAYYTLGEVLDYSAKYNLSLKGIRNTLHLDIKTPSVEITTMPAKCILYDYSVTDINGNEVEEIGDLKSITVSTEIAADVGQKFSLALAIFNNNGRLIKVVSDTKTVEPEKTQVKLTTSTPADIDLSSGCVVRQYVWEENAVNGDPFIYVPNALQ